MGCCKSTSSRQDVYKPHSQTPLAGNSPEQKEPAGTQLDVSKAGKRILPGSILQEDPGQIDSPKVSARGFTAANIEDPQKEPGISKNKPSLTGGRHLHDDPSNFQRTSMNADDLQSTKTKGNVYQLDPSTTRVNKGQTNFSDPSSDMISKSMATILNGYEAMFHENQSSENFFFEMNEVQVKRYEEFLDNSKLQESMMTEGPGSKASGMNEWSRTLLKHSTVNEKSGTTNPSEGRSTLDVVYKAVLALRERYWYDELIGLYKEKHANKQSGNMSSLTFERKFMTLQVNFEILRIRRYNHVTVK